ncbi:hypothetical protein BV898_09242 [Hypsibius exemplaris]|uniref:G-protein coupled receptors family 1 profile domain-containing protein n=1 Tax=Hypsibius exemplaris TaxID=2072580 RepID=A0A1W0WN04_HYPEX|nr:hypothetical protein BV898_09242 [Hypsibius exemplaris]
MAANNTTTTNKTQIAVRVNCTLTVEQDQILNWVPIGLSTLIMLCQVFNVSVFHVWRNREPFVLFHISLCYSSLILGINSFINPICRMVPWNWTTQMVAKAAVVSYGIINRVCVINTLLISVDRWVSVEFAVFYRNFMTHRRSRIIAAVTWTVALAITVPGIAVYHSGVIVSCNRPSNMNFRINGTAGEPWQVFLAFVAKGPYFIPLLFLFQARILMVAVMTRLRMNRMRQVMRVGPNVVNSRRLTRARMAVNLVWNNLAGSMVVVLGTVLANIPYNVLEFTGLNRGDAAVALLKLQNYLFIVQYLYTPAAYMIFFPLYRAVVYRPFRAVARVWKKPR